MQDFFPLGKRRVRATVREISSTASTETSRQAKEDRRAQISPGGCHGHCQLLAKVGSHGLDSLEDGLLHSTCIKRQRWLNRHRKINRKGQETLSAAKKWVISHNGASWPWRLRCGGRGCARGFLLRGQTDRQTDRPPLWQKARHVQAPSGAGREVVLGAAPFQSGSRNPTPPS